MLVKAAFCFFFRQGIPQTCCHSLSLYEMMKQVGITHIVSPEQNVNVTMNSNSNSSSRIHLQVPESFVFWVTWD